MRSLSRSLMAFLALLSLLATLVPSLAWACPITGRIGTPVEVCAPFVPCHNPKMEGMACCRQKPHKKVVSVSANQPCIYSGCCLAVVAPNSAPLAATVSSKTSSTVAQSFELFSASDFVAAAPRQAHAPLLILPALYGPEISPPHSQLSFSLHSGRAPPVA